MRRAVVYAPAKLNLTLDILSRREDGYHTVDMLMQTVDLYDRITVERVADKGICLCLPDTDLPTDEKNTAYRAAKYFFETLGMPTQGVRLTVEKQIPQQAGMAGGSADAAGVLVGMNALWGTPMTMEQLCEIGGRIGADVPFCLLGGAARATGIGTDLAPVSLLLDCAVLVVKPDCGVSTAEAYRAVDTARITRRPDTQAMLRALEEGDLTAVGKALCNVFEEAIGLPEVARVRMQAQKCGARGCIMTGSGSAVFALFDNVEKAIICRERLKKEFSQNWICRPCGGPMLAEIE